VFAACVNNFNSKNIPPAKRFFIAELWAYRCFIGKPFASSPPWFRMPAGCAFLSTSCTIFQKPLLIRYVDIYHRTRTHNEVRFVAVSRKSFRFAPFSHYVYLTQALFAPTICALASSRFATPLSAFRPRASPILFLSSPWVAACLKLFLCECLAR
jgi:hypothetical protein